MSKAPRTVAGLFAGRHSARLTIEIAEKVAQWDQLARDLQQYGYVTLTPRLAQLHEFHRTLFIAV
jgi:hypothetical protein